MKKIFNFLPYKVHCSFSEEILEIAQQQYLGWPLVTENGVEGIYLNLIAEADSLTLKNDLYGLYRVYYWEKDHEIFLTDNPDSFLQPEEYRNLQVNAMEKELFDKSLGYTSGDSTFYEEIKKLPPASEMKINRDGLRINFYYPYRKILRTPDRQKHVALVKQSVYSILSPLKDRPETKILFFSGGADSCYIAKCLNDLNIAYKAIFMYNIGQSKRSEKALRDAKKQLKSLQIANFEVLKINPADSSMDRQITSTLRFDRHSAKMHYLTMQKIVETYGRNIIVINGQNSDSIFSYGPSEKSFSSLLKRYLMYGRNVILKHLFAVFCSIYCKRFMRLMRNEAESLFVLCSGYKYLHLYDLSYSKKCRSYFENKLSFLMGKMNLNQNCMQMFCKIFFFIQGPDSMVVVQSAKSHNISLLVLPFATHGALEATLQYKDDRYELTHPKYCIRELDLIESEAK